MYNKTKYITLELKSKVGNQFPTTYKKAIKHFEERMPHKFIMLIHDLKEIFMHNKTTLAIQHNAVIQNLLFGELLNTNKTSLEKYLVNPNDATKTIKITMEIVKSSMQEFAKIIFPFCALDKQKAYMERHMQKLRELKV